MGELIRNKDWSTTSLGPIEHWPQSLTTTLNILLNSKFPMFLEWGPELICFYNDAYRPSLGTEGKHPSILGMPAKEAWSEIWKTIEPLVDMVLNKGESTWSEDQLIPIFRNGKIEDVYWTFSYSPARDDSGNIAGIFITCVETTQKVIANKKLQESEERFRQMAESTDILIGLGDETSNAIYFNQAWVNFTGTPMAALLKFGWADIVHPDDKDQYINTYLSHFTERTGFTKEFRALRKDGNFRWILTNGQPQIFRRWHISRLYFFGH